MKEKLESLGVGKVLSDIDIKDFSTFNISSKIPFLILPDSLESLIRLLKFLKEEGVRYKIIGKCSNLVFVQTEFKGVLIRLDFLSKIEISDEEICIGAGVPLMGVAMNLSMQGYKGFEFATGIPGSIGGSIVQNAGCYGSSLSDIVTSIKVLTPNFKVEEWDAEKICFSYRNSYLKEHSEYICLEARFKLEKGSPEEILDSVKKKREARRLSQPYEYPSAGSVFRNPENIPAGKIIEDLGLKGLSIGDAEVSHKHANFIVNKGNATGRDVLLLVEKIKEKVYEIYGIDLICEIEFIE